MQRLLLYKITLFRLVLMLCALSTQAAIQTDGPLTGGVTESSARIFVRTDVTASVQIEYSSLSDLNESALSDTQYTEPDRDYTAIIELDNLAPQTIYYYRVLVDGVAQQQADML
jgi:alkaline phosphatase D